MGDSLGDELAVLDERAELLWDGDLCDVVLGPLAGQHDVHLVRLGGDNLRVKAVLRQKDLDARGLVDSDRGHLAGDLQLNRVTVHNLSHADGVVKHDAGLLAAVCGGAKGGRSAQWLWRLGN